MKGLKNFVRKLLRWRLTNFTSVPAAIETNYIKQLLYFPLLLHLFLLQPFVTMASFLYIWYFDTFLSNMCVIFGWNYNIGLLLHTIRFKVDFDVNNSLLLSYMWHLFTLDAHFISCKDIASVGIRLIVCNKVYCIPPEHLLLFLKLMLRSQSFSMIMSRFVINKTLWGIDVSYKGKQGHQFMPSQYSFVVDTSINPRNMMHAAQHNRAINRKMHQQNCFFSNNNLTQEREEKAQCVHKVHCIYKRWNLNKENITFGNKLCLLSEVHSKYSSGTFQEVPWLETV